MPSRFLVVGLLGHLAACDAGLDPTPELHQGDPLDELAISALGDPHACTGAPSPAQPTADGLFLAAFDVHTPDPARTGASLYRTAFDADLVPLQTAALTFLGTSVQRAPAPTTVRVVLDKVESLRSGTVASGKVSRLGKPERVTLVAGDTLEVITWNGNYTGSTVYIGVALDGAKLGDLLKGMTVTAATGGNPVAGTLAGSPVAGAAGNHFGQKLAPDAYGGFVLRGTVKAPALGAAAWEVAFTELASFSTSAQGSLAIDYATAEAIYADLEPKPALHQQGQYYGGYAGSTTLAKGDRVVIAAPGSYAYHGSDYQGLIDADDKQAAYWVPLELSIAVGTAAPTKLRATTATGQYVNSSAVVIEATNKSGTKTQLVPGTAASFQGPGKVTVTFLGTSATALALEAL